MDTRLGRNIALAVDKTGGTTFVAIGVIKDISDLGSQSVDFADTTLLADLYKQFRPVDIDPGEVQFIVQMDPNDGTNQLLVDMLEDLDTLPNWQVTYADVGTGSETEDFRAYISALGRETGKGEHLVRPVTLRITGDPGLTGSP